MHGIRVIMFLLVLLVLGRVPATYAAADRPDAADTRIGWFLYAGGGGWRTYDVMDIRHVRSFRNGRLDLDVSLLPTLSFVTMDRLDDPDETSTCYNFRGAVNGLLWLATELAGGVEREDGDIVKLAPWVHVLYAPDTRLRFRVSEKISLRLGSRADYILYKTARTERGVLVTPHIGLSLMTGDLGQWDYGGLSASLGYRTFWNFDGPDRSGDLTLLVAWWWGAGT